MKSASILFSSTIASVLLGCATAALPASRADEGELLSKLDASASARFPIDCGNSLHFEIARALKRFRAAGVTSASDGVFYFVAGDSYIWLDALYIGPRGNKFVVVWANSGKERVIAQADYQHALDLAKMVDNPGDGQSVPKDHDACEYLTWRESGLREARSSVRGVNIDTSLSTSESNEPTFRKLREFLLSLRQEK